MNRSEMCDVYPLHVPIFFARPEPRPGHRILAEIADRYGFAVNHLLGQNRCRPFVAARQHAMYKMAAEAGLGLSAIGRIMKRDHATVSHGIHAHAKRHNLPKLYWVVS